MLKLASGVANKPTAGAAVTDDAKQVLDCDRIAFRSFHDVLDALYRDLHTACS